MAPVTLPPSFYNSFWSPDYRTGLDVLFRQLEAGSIENKDVASFIESQARAHHQLSATLMEPPLGANRQSTSSLQHTLLTLRGGSSARGDAHRALAIELEEKILVPFNVWRSRHDERISSSRDEMLGKSGSVAEWEKSAHRLMGQNYIVKSRAADDSEDDAKFAPAVSAGTTDSYTPSPTMASPLRSPLRRSGTVADRISEKLRQASVPSSPLKSNRDSVASLDGRNSLGSIPESAKTDKENGAASKEKKAQPPAPLKLDAAAAIERTPGAESPASPKEDAFIPPTDPDGQPIMQSDMPPPVPGKDDPQELPPQPQSPVLLSGLTLSAKDFRNLLLRFDQFIQTHAAMGTQIHGDISTRAALASRQRSTIIGQYEKTFSGFEFVDWLSRTVEGFGGEWDRCVDAAVELHRMNHLSRCGVGRGFEASDDTYFILRVDPQDNMASIQNSLTSSLNNLNMPSYSTKDISTASSSAMASASAHIPAYLKNYLPSSMGHSDEPAHVRLRREAGKADGAYHDGVRETEALRLELEEKIERGLRVWEKWERERLGVVRGILKQYEEALGKLPQRLADLQESAALCVQAFNPEADLKALIEGSRTGPFRPRPYIYESVESDLPDVNFGIDLRRWSGETAWKSMVNAPPRPKDAIPAVLEGLLQAATELGADLEPEERRRSWIYEVPLEELHMLRAAVNSPMLTADEVATIAKKFNAPIVCGTTKLWLLELNPPVVGWEGWEDAKAVYPSIGADLERDTSSAISSVLARLPASQLYTLNTVIKYFKDLIRSTKSTPDADKIYTTKLSLSAGRCVLRPQYETELTIQDRTPGLFLADMIEHYEDVFPPLLEKKKQQAERVMPYRKRTVLVDQRISRSDLARDFDPQELLAQQAKRASLDGRRSPTKAPAVEIPVPAVAEPEALPVSPAGDEFKTPLGTPAAEPANPVPVVAATPPPAPAPAVPAAVPAETSPVDAPASGRTTPSRSSVHSATGPAPDEVIAPAAGGLKRNTSSEASRLRGPKGARGPRPAPGHAGHSQRGSVSKIAAQFENGAK